METLWRRLSVCFLIHLATTAAATTTTVISTTTGVATDLPTSPSTIYSTTWDLDLSTSTEDFDLSTVIAFSGASNVQCENRHNFGAINAADYRLEIEPGHFVVTIVSQQPTSARFVAQRLRQIGVISRNMTLGVRVIVVLDPVIADDLVEEEMIYLQTCAEFPIGMFITSDLWGIMDTSMKRLDYNVWQMPAQQRLSYTNALKLLSNLPWPSNANLSAEIQSITKENVKEFLKVARKSDFCLPLASNLTNLALLLDPSATPSEDFAPNGALVALSSNLTDPSTVRLPPNSYLVVENPFDLNGTQTLISEFVLTGALLAELALWLNDTIALKCRDVNLSSGCAEIFQDAPVISYAFVDSIADLTRVLRLETSLDLSVDLIQKRLVDRKESGEVMELRKLASFDLMRKRLKILELQSVANSTLLKDLVRCPKGGKEEATTEILIPTSSSVESEMYWRIKPEAWVAAGLTTATLGIILSLSILTFILSRVCIRDVLEGNPMGSILLLLALVAQFASFIPFSIEYVGFHSDPASIEEAQEILNTHCSVKVFLVSLCYCVTFSLVLCRAIMLASIGSEGGFLSHVNGYIQSIICFFSTIVQFGLSTQLLVLLNTSTKELSCDDLYYGNWFWGIVAYDAFLLILLAILAPFIFRSQRNYREGILTVIGSLLCVVVWTIWIPLCLVDNKWREAAIPLGAQATALAILGGIMVPRCVLIIKGIARSDLVQALPSLTSLAFAQANNQYVSEPSIYNCVNHGMRQNTSAEEETYVDSDNEGGGYPSPSNVPTLPLRTNRNSNHIHRYYQHQNQDEDQCTLDFTTPPSPSKVTRF